MAHALKLKMTDFPEPGNHRGFRGFGSSAVALELSPEQAAELLDIDGLLARAELVKDSRTTTCGIVESAAGTVFVKRYNAYNFRKKLSQLLGVPRPSRVLEATMKLQSFVPVPKLLAAVAEKRGLFARLHGVVCEACRSPLTAAEQIADVHSRLDEFAVALAVIVNTMHCKGIYHGDLKLFNILMRRNHYGVRVGLFDFDSTRCGGSAVAGSRRAGEWARVITSYLWCCRNAGIPETPEHAVNVFTSAAGSLDMHELFSRMREIEAKTAAKEAES